MKKYLFLFTAIISFLNFNLYCAHRFRKIGNIPKGEELIAAVGTGTLRHAPPPDLDKIKKIIEQGVDINKKDNHGYTALNKFLNQMTTASFYEGVKQKDIEILKFLLNQPNIDVNFADVYGSSPFDYLYRIVLKDKNHSKIQLKDVKEILKQFLEHGLDLHRKNLYGKSFFDFAKEDKLLQEAYAEYLAELKKKHADLCAQLDKDLPFMSKDLTDLIAGYVHDVQECKLIKKD